jgi:hypothetical protein
VMCDRHLCGSPDRPASHHWPPEQSIASPALLQGSTSQIRTALLLPDRGDFTVTPHRLEKIRSASRHCRVQVCSAAQ